jgi:uncharacterized HTH-type transcriptional regulator HI_1052
MDCLDKLIQLAQVSGEVNIRCLFQGQWQIQPNIAENQYVGAFHLIEQGECWLTLDKKQIHLQAGDIFFLPQNRPHLIAGQAQNLSENNVPHAQNNRSTLFKVYSIGQNSADLKMFCGLFYYSKPSLLIDSLPEYLHLSLNDTPVQPLIRLMQQEADNHQSGAKSLMDALVTVLFIYILRHGLQANLLHCGLFAGLQDKRLGKVLEQLFNAPQQAWNMDVLAALAAMSRANFMRVFQQKIGMAPGKFLTQLRLQEAALLLNKTQKNILSVALEVGYQSEAHFSKAFKALYGMTPSQYRKAEQV